MNLHDHTRRLLSLLIFFLLGPTLTVGVLVGIGLRRLPDNARRFEHELSQGTGVQWKVRKVEYRSPDCVRLLGVEIVDEISLKSVFEADYVDVKQLDGKNPKKYFSDQAEGNQNGLLASELLTLLPGLGSKKFRLISIPNSVVKLDHFSSEQSAAVVWMTFSRLMARLPHLSEEPVLFALDSVGLFTEHSRQKTGKVKFEPLRFVQGNLYRTDDGIRSDWTFQLPDVSQLETQKLSVVRNDSGGFEIELQTGKTPIPCETASGFCSLFGHFGPGSRFSGDFSVLFHDATAGSRTIRLKDIRLRDIDLARAAAIYTSFDVTGTVADFQITRAAFGPEAFFANGFLHVVKGELEATLFNRFVQQFDLTVRPGDLVESPQTTIPYDDCAVHFQLQPDGAVFRPDERWPDGLIMGRAGDGVRAHPMTVHFPTDRPRPVSYHAILSLLAPDTAPVVPLTPSLKKLYSFIPVPEIRLPNIRSKKTSSETENPEMLAGSEIMKETARDGDRFLATEPLPAPASAGPAVANPVTVPTPSNNLPFVTPKRK